MRVLNAAYDEEKIIVYQAFRPEIVRAAVEAGTFAAGFSLDRMTWIKPSFGWMLHRSGYATKTDQEAIARITMTRAGFETILADAVLSAYDARVYETDHAWSDALKTSPVRVQWDPDRDLFDRKLEVRAIQIGLKGDAVKRYVREWIVGVEDITPMVRELHLGVQRSGTLPDGIPHEREYPLSEPLRARLGC